MFLRFPFEIVDFPGEISLFEASGDFYEIPVVVVVYLECEICDFGEDGFNPFGWAYPFGIYP